MLAAAAVAALILFPAVSPAATGPTAVLTSTPTPATGKAPLAVTFDGSGSSDADGTIISWSIDFGDGSSDSGTGLPPSSEPHTYAVGTYTATLTVTDDNAATDSASLAVNSKANVAPTAVLTSSPTPATGKAPLTVTFNGSASSDSDGSIASWTLDFGDGNSTSGSGAPPASKQHSYAAGTYTAKLTVTDDDGATDSASLAVNSKANVAPNAVLTSSPTPATGKAPLSVTFNGSGSSDSDGSIASWTLDFGDGNSTSGNGAPPASKQHSYAAGTYTAKLTVTDDDGATDSASLAVNSKANVAPNAVLTSSPTPATGKAPLSVTFNGSASSDSDGSIASWTLDFGDGSTVAGGNGTPPSSLPHSYAAGTYTAKLTVTDDNGASGTASVAVSANAPPTAVLTENKTAPGPAAVSLNGSGSSDPDGSIASWNLDFGDGNSQSGSGAPPADIPHTYATAGSYTAKLTVTDNQGAVSNPSSVQVVIPSISIGDVSKNEGNSGTTNFVFTLTLSAKSTHDVTVAYATANGTAAAGSDYTTTSGTLTISAGTDCKTNPAGNPACTITVPVTGDTAYEVNETFTLTLSNPTGATITRAVATGTIANDDQQPEVTIERGATQEGNAGSKVDSGGAQSWSAGGNLKLADARGFPSGFGAHTFYISTPGSQGESGPFKYTGVSGNTLTGVSPAGSVTVGQWAFQPRFVSIPVVLCDVQQTQANGGVCVPTTSGFDTTVQFKTSDGHSLTTSIPVVMGQDYVYSAGTLTIPAGQSSGSINFQTIPNTTPENPTIPGDDLTRWFNVLISAPTNATLLPGGALGQGTIIDDDAPNPPKATTGSASAIGTDHVTVSATVNPNGPATDVYVEYGLTDAYGSQTAKQSLPAGNTDQPLSFSLTGLSPATTYHYQVVATHADGGTGYGGDSTFTTAKPNVPPTAVLTADKTQAAAAPLTVKFDGSGSADPDGSIASWKLTFGDNTSTSGSGPVPSSISHMYSTCTCTASLTVTDNQGAQSTAATVSIKVGPTGPPTLPGISDYDIPTLEPQSATIVFTVTPNGAETRAWVEYGTTKSYGEMSGVKTIPAGPAQRLSFPLTDLSPNTVYHFALFAAHTTDSGAVHSQDLTFRTPAAKAMSAKQKRGSLRATAGGIVPLSLSCAGNVATKCVGRAVLRLGKLAAGSVSFAVAKGPPKRVTLKLKKTILKRLLVSSGLRFTLTLTVQTGNGGPSVKRRPVLILPPRK